jgi:hypothetical protein
MTIKTHHVSVGHLASAKGADHGPLWIELDYRIGGCIDQRVRAQQHKDMPSTVAGDIADQSPSGIEPAEGPFDPIHLLSKGNDELMLAWSWMIGSALHARFPV